MLKYALFLLSTVLFTCSPKSAQLNSTDELTLEQDCFSDRKIDGTVENLKVKILTKSDKYFFVRENTHYEPCEIPPEFAVEGMEVIIAGDIMEIYPNERRMGTPFHLKSIRK